jgi:sugar lactone lactonase YvrE
MMRKLNNLIFTLMLLSVPVDTQGAEPIKLRYITSVYSDVNGGGIKLPEGVACDEKALLIVADTGNGRILKYTFQDNLLKGGEEITVPEITYPSKAQVNSKGDIFLLDGRKKRIVRLNPDGSLKGLLSFEGIPSASSIMTRSFKIDLTDNIYIMDLFSGRVIVLNPAGTFLREIPFPKTSGVFSDLAVGPNGTVYLLDSINAVIFSVSGNDKEFTALSKGLKEYVTFASDIAVDNRGNIFLADTNSGNIAVIGPDGVFLTRLLSFGWKEGLLRYPSQICLRGNGDFFIADRENSRVQIFKLAK